jgi:hypothetical protein
VQPQPSDQDLTIIASTDPRFRQPLDLDPTDQIKSTGVYTDQPSLVITFLQ